MHVVMAGFVQFHANKIFKMKLHEGAGSTVHGLQFYNNMIFQHVSLVQFLVCNSMTGS